MKRFVLVDGAKEEIDKIFEKARVTKKEVAELLDISPSAFHYKMQKESSFSEQERKTLLEAFPEIQETWFKPHKYGDCIKKNAEIASPRKRYADRN